MAGANAVLYGNTVGIYKKKVVIIPSIVDSNSSRVEIAVGRWPFSGQIVYMSGINSLAGHSVRAKFTQVRWLLASVQRFH